MLLEPEKYAPKAQFHGDADGLHRATKPIVYDVKVDADKDLDTVYKTHSPLGATLSQLADESTARSQRQASKDHNARGPTADIPAHLRRG